MLAAPACRSEGKRGSVILLYQDQTTLKSSALHREHLAQPRCLRKKNEMTPSRGLALRGLWKSGRNCGCAFYGRNAREASCHGDMRKSATGVLSSQNLRTRHIIRDHCVNLGFLVWGLTCDRESDGERLTRRNRGNNVNRHRRTPILCLKRSPDRVPIAPDDLYFSVHDNLRRINTVQVKTLAVRILPIREGRLRKRIRPAELIPVRDMLADPHDQLPRVGPCPVNPSQQSIRGRTTGASLRGKQFH
jgi:hypothetical protein